MNNIKKLSFIWLLGKNKLIRSFPQPSLRQGVAFVSLEPLERKRITWEKLKSLS